MMAKKLWILLIAGMLVPAASVFSGGSSDGSGKGPKTVTVWMGAWWKDQAPVIEKAYAETHDTILKIETYPYDGYIEKITTAIVGNVPPDAVALDDGMLNPLAGKNLLQPFPGVARADFSSGMWDAGMYQGKQYGIPYRSDATGIFYNMDIFDAAGIPYPTNDWTWDEFLQMAKAVTIPGERYGYGVAGSAAAASDGIDQLLPIIWSYGGEVIRDGRCVLDEPEAIAAIQFWIDLVRVHGVSPQGSVNYDTKDYIEFFISGRLAMIEGASNLVPTFKENAKNIRWDFASNPGGNFARSSGYSFAVPVGAKNSDGAREFIEWFTQPDNLSRLTIRMPGRSSATTSAPWNEPIYKKILKATETTRNQPIIPEWVEIRTVIIRQLQRAMTGEATVKEAARIMTDSANAILGVK
ncbi:ABC transporter substrate-binding protein [Breznakiella homolactica]|uniref:Sugar ABC transporter substrate-binding protein n=1 Tax=Breznakiella homolactica TaxID=2798577 RepID=A0A7T7XKT4_9SPIR|nr:sugar ABC transporter substrate-binding protein [Breznakiella homolactica]QQO08097.1 sugar ABC transporter substrate-binding protein [Breznakiella homolactica]